MWNESDGGVCIIIVVEEGMDVKSQIERSKVENKEKIRTYLILDTSSISPQPAVKNNRQKTQPREENRQR